MGVRMGLSKVDAGGVITYDTGSGQNVAVSTEVQSNIWPAPKATAQILVLAA